MNDQLARFDICLVGTQNAENLGATARLMDNFGLSSLWLVSPRVLPADSKANQVARTARARLHEAKVVPKLSDAVAQATYVVGMTARSGDRRETVNLRDAAVRLAAFPIEQRLALVFGPEDAGLSSEDTEACDLLCTIPTRGPLSSLNLSQAVGVVLWEISQAGVLAKPPEYVRGGATREEIEGFLDHAFEVLDRFDYFREKDAARKRTDLRRVLVHAGLTGDEVKGLRGVCRQALWALEQAHRSPDGEPSKK